MSRILAAVPSVSTAGISIAEPTQVLHDEGLTSHQADLAAAVARNVARLTALTEDIRPLSDVSTTEVHVVDTLELDLRAVVSSADEAFARLGTGNHLRLRLDMPDHPVLVRGDPHQLESLVLRLICNAVEFADDEGTIICRLSSTPTEVLLAVADADTDIPTAEQEQLDTSLTDCSADRERTSVDSAVSRGTIFMIRLPALDEPGASTAAAPPGWELVADGLRLARARTEVRDLSGPRRCSGPGHTRETSRTGVGHER